MCIRCVDTGECHIAQAVTGQLLALVFSFDIDGVHGFTEKSNWVETLPQATGWPQTPSLQRQGFSALEFILKTEVALNSQISPCLCLPPIPNTGVKGVLDPPAPVPWFLLRLQVCTTSGTTLGLEVWIPAIYTDVTEQTRTSRAWAPQGWKRDFPGLFCPLYIKGIPWPH